MGKVYVAGKQVSYSDSGFVSKGGEADVYDIGRGLALKVYKTPDHPDWEAAGPAEARALKVAAAARLQSYQSKLPAFPLHLPARVVAPCALAYDAPGPNARIAGYTMPLVRDANMLFHYSRRKFREAALLEGVTAEQVRDLLLDLHATVRGIHAAGVVIGDFNDLNVLARGSQAFIVDADSFQYPGFPCSTYQLRFLDPLLCDPAQDHPEMVRPHNCDSDWYAYAVMVMACLLYVDPYGGVYRPRNRDAWIPEHARLLRRITVFHPDVQYPRPAIPYSLLPDELQNYLHETFVGDLRAEFPAALLQDLRWTRCSRCGAEHARQACPTCHRALPAAPKVRPAEVVRGGVVARRIFHTGGHVVAAAVVNGALRWLYLQDGELRREDGSVAARVGPAMPPGMRIRLGERRTYLGRGGEVVALSPGEAPARTAVDQYQAIPLFDANSGHVYRIEGGRLVREGFVAPLFIGEVLAHQTLLWVGETFGMAFYRAGPWSGTMIFDTERAGMNDHVALPPLRGQLLDATCVFGHDRCWFLAQTQEGGDTVNTCYLVMRDGAVIAAHRARDGDGTWLGTLQGKCAVGTALLAPTDAGVVRLEAEGSSIRESKTFPETDQYVNSASQLLAGRNGLYVVQAHEIHMLTISP
jgi:hypothetical protein